MSNDHSENDNGALKPAPGPGADPYRAPREEAEQKPQREALRGGTALAGLALLTALAAVAGTAWMWWQGQHSDIAGKARLQGDIARLESNDQRLATQFQALTARLDALSSAGDSDPLADLDDRLAGDRARAQELRESLREQVALARSQQQAVDAMHARLLAAEAALAVQSGRQLDAPAELGIAEVDYLLRLASERLQLFADPVAADRALALADAQLAALDNPSYLGVRKAIAGARGELGAVDAPDRLALAGHLDALQKAVPTLPFPDGAGPAADAAPGPEAGWWEKLKATFASLVTVRRSTEAENRRLSLEDRDYIRQRMWLQLEVAYLALMRDDPPGFATALDRAQASVDEWFDPESSAVQSFERNLENLRAQDLDVAWPDISAPWVALRLVRSARAKPGAGAPVPEMPAVAGGEPERLPESKSAAPVPDEGQ